MANLKKEIIPSLAILLLNAVLYINGLGLRENAWGYPRMLIICSSIFCLILFAKGIYTKVKEDHLKTISESSEGKTVDVTEKMILLKTIIAITISCVAMLTYILVIKYIGYILATVLFIAGVLIYFRIKKWWIVLSVSVGITAVLYFMFNNILLILLPTGSLFKGLL